MSSLPKIALLPRLLSALCLISLLALPAHAFTADSLAITVQKNGDAQADFRFTLEGVVENLIPQSMLEEQLQKGLATSSEPPELLSMDRSSASVLMKNFADLHDLPNGTAYVTATMDFKKAEIALQQSAVSSVITADFSPKVITLTFPDGYVKTFNDQSALPSVTHIVVDSAKAAANGSAPSSTGTIIVMSSPAGAQVAIDDISKGNTPQTVRNIAPGTHTVTIQKDGFLPVSRTVKVTAGNTTAINEVLSYAEATTYAGVETAVIVAAVILGALFFAGRDLRNRLR